MNKFEILENDVQNLNTDARRALAAKLLSSEANRLEGSMIPLDSNHKLVVKEEREEHALEIIAVAALAAGVIALGAAVCWRVKKGIEKQAEKEKIRLAEERKEMIQKLSRIKGRAW